MRELNISLRLCELKKKSYNHCIKRIVINWERLDVRFQEDASGRGAMCAWSWRTGGAVGDLGDPG